MLNNYKNVRRIQGYAGYYRKFIKDFAAIMRPPNGLFIGNVTNLKSCERVSYETGADLKVVQSSNKALRQLLTS